MLLNLVFLSAVAAAGTIVGQPSSDHSCAPDMHAIDAHASDKTACTVTTANSRIVQFDCTPTTQIAFDSVANMIVLMAAEPRPQGFTIHGSCTEDGRQVAHVDLHMPLTNAHGITQHTFAGLNRKCDIGRKKKPQRIHFSTYTMSTAEHATCLKNPVDPLN